MEYNAGAVTYSQRIYQYLLDHKGTLNEQDRNPDARELYDAYSEDTDVMNLLEDQAKIADCKIEKFEGTIYLIPNVDNTRLGFTKTELKKALCRSNATSTDYYLSQFIIFTLLSELYDGEGVSCKTREFIQTGELQSIVSKRLEEGLANEKKQEESPDDVTPNDFLDFEGMSDAYETLKSVDAGGNKSRSTKEGIINAICTFLESQGLIHLDQESDRIHPTSKLDCLMEYRILSNENYEYIKGIMKVINNE